MNLPLALGVGVHRGPKHTPGSGHRAAALDERGRLPSLLGEIAEGRSSCGIRGSDPRQLGRRGGLLLGVGRIRSRRRPTGRGTAGDLGCEPRGQIQVSVRPSHDPPCVLIRAQDGLGSAGRSTMASQVPKPLSDRLSVGLVEQGIALFVRGLRQPGLATAKELPRHRHSEP